MSELILTPISQPILTAFAVNNIPLKGILQQTNEGYIYLKIDDQFIYSLFPLLQIKGKTLPPYFSEPYNIGAHISVIYKEEFQKSFEILKIEELGTLIHFDVTDLFRAKINQKIFFALTINSNALIKIRKKYGFSEKPVYHGIPVDWHITIATGTFSSLA